MAIVGTCPSCGARAPLDTYLLDSDARRAFATLCERLADYPDVVRRLPGYLALHSAPGRAAAWGKVTRLIGEITDLVLQGQVTRNNAMRWCPPSIWAKAMDEAQDARSAGSLTLPLDGHGWLCQVAWTAAGRAEAQAEANRQALARGETPTGYSSAHQIGGSGAGGSGALAATGRLPEHSLEDAASGRGRPSHVQELISDLRALARLEAVTPGPNAPRIAQIRERLAALGIPDPTQPTPTTTGA